MSSGQLASSVQPLNPIENDNLAQQLNTIENENDAVANEKNGNTNDDKSTTNIIINEPNTSTDTQSPKRIDTNAINGLRGIVAVHIMIFHSLWYSELHWNTLGSVQMTLFFLISGFVFGISDGKQKYYPTKCCTETNRIPETTTVATNYQKSGSFIVDNNEYKHFDGRNYYQRRIARTIPLFYLTNLMCIPLCFSGHGWGTADDMIFKLILTFFTANTWLALPQLYALNGPSWFVSTIWFFYWVSPSLIPKLQMDNVRKQKWCWYYFWIQFIVGLVLFYGIVFVAPWLSFYIATFWPPSRLPVFIMGILAGLLRNEGLGISSRCDNWTVEKWKKVTDWNALTMVIIFIVFSFIESGLFPINTSFWLQLAYAWGQLYLIISLTFDEGTSVTYKILTSKVALFFGRISYALYLVHEPFIQYINWFVYGPITPPDCEYDESDECNDLWDSYNSKKMTMPIWCIPILWIVSTVIAIILNRFVEEPMRKWLRPAKK